MLATAHAGVGTVIARRTTSVGQAAFWGITSHYLLDTLPHWGLAVERHSSDEARTQFMRVAVVDGVAAALLTVARLRCERRRGLVALAVALAVLPDINKPMELVRIERLYPRPLRTFHTTIQRREAPHYWPVDLAVASLSWMLGRPRQTPTAGRDC